MSAIIETIRRPAVVAAVAGGAGLGTAGVKIYHAVTENFLHCEISTSEQLQPGSTVTLEIVKPLEERIAKGGEIEALAKVIK